MPAILDICKTTVVVGQGADGTGGTSTDYYFKTTRGLYEAGSNISSKTGITAESVDDDWSDFPLTSIKELLRGEIIHDLKVKVGSSSGGSSNAATTTYVKGIHYNDAKSNTVEGDLIGETWPVGKGAGGTIQAAYTPRRVVSRR